MQTLGQYFAAIALLVQGVWLGVAIADAVIRPSIWMRMSTVDFATDFRRHILRADPMQPILAILSTLCGVVLALRAETTTARLIWASVALMTAIIVASVTLAEPVNSKFRRLSEGTPPEGAEQLRAFWCRFHRVRTLVGGVAFTCLVVAIAGTARI